MNSKPYQKLLRTKEDLVTTYEETRAGFIALALEKNRLATPYVEQAQILKAAASQAKNAKDLIRVSEIRPALLSASGISDKASNYMNEDDKDKAILGLVEGFLEPAGESFVEELVYRFLLTKGDALGGSMRNVGGVLAQRKLARLAISYLNLQQIPYSWKDNKTNAWVSGNLNDDDLPEVEMNIKGISWTKENRDRTILFNVGVPFLGNNIDVVMLDSPYQEISSSVSAPEKYIALGELKGGIDPAGADEHWKTASTALERIRQSFSANNFKPATFFIGAAIATRMASEIWRDLESERLTNAANLTNNDQVTYLCQWLCNL